MNGRLLPAYSDLRTRALRWPPLSAARTRAVLALSPVLRAGIARVGHSGRFVSARWLLPGSIAQVREELLAFGKHAAARQPVNVCEIGTQHGGTSLFLCGLGPSVRTFVGVDLRPGNADLVRALAPPGVEVKFLEGSSRDPAVRARLDALLGGGRLDLLFIDGDHTYDGVLADLREYRELVRSGGLIAFHDIRPVDGGAQVNKLAWSGEVHVLWRQLRDRFRHWEFVRDPHQDGYGIGVIEHDPDVALEAR